MNGRTRRVGAHRRAVLLHGWQLCAQPPSTDPDQPPGDAADWIAAPRLGTVAAVLRAAGRWSLDGAPLRFDAFHWWYRLCFDLPDGFGADDLVLGFDGLATLARVWLNGEPLLDSDNMFVRHECTAGPRLRRSGNELLLRFASLDQALAARRPRPRWRAPMVENQQLRWWRTTLLGRTPGWSPPSAPVGPWRDIWLEDRGGVRCEVHHLQSGARGSLGRLDLACTLDAPGGVKAATLTLTHSGRSVGADLARGAAAEWRLHLDLPEVALWWPHTHGEPALYEARLRVVHGRGEAFEVELGRVGFRELIVDRTNGDFAIAVNGVPVFCRGACWTPIDPVSLQAPASAYRAALARCREAGMNMLRVAGPMVYEDDAFLDACDEQGVLVWQDFMFASMDYPVDDPAFAASVEAEVRQQAARWQGRPSLAVLCGNSEVSQQAAMWGAAREFWMPPWFQDTLPALVKPLLPEAAFWPSSAWGGAFPHQVDAGTVSYYGVGAYLRPEDDARRSGLRFASECLGFSNVPEPEALARLPGGLATRVTHAAWKARAPRDLGAGWDFEDVRDHYLQRLFGLEPAKLRYADHERYLALSRVASGETMARAFTEWRAAGSSCRGALVWLLRDLWAGAGWGLLDDAGQPKACWHALRRVLQPRTVLLTDEGGSGLVAHLVNEAAEPLVAVLDISAWRGATATARAERRVELAPRSTDSLSLMALFDHFTDLNHAYRFGPLNHDVVMARLRDEAGRPLARAFHFPGGMELPREADLGLQALASLTPEGAVQLRVSTQRFALGVHIDAAGLQPDDQYFHLAPGDEHVVSLHPADGRARPWRCSIQALNAASAVNVRAPNGG
jgi:beta-mannosidase